MGKRPSAAEQIARNKALAKPFIERFKRGPRRDRIAARRLFSVLSRLEQIAVMAASSGNGVEDQLDDEIAHRDSFEWIALQLGHVDPISPAVQALTDFLGGLSAADSILCLNLVAESWLENVFHHLAEAGPWRDLFAIIEDEEARHSSEAAEAAKAVDRPRAQALVRVLEEHLWRVTIDPHFFYPLAWFVGAQGAGRMGQKASVAHRRSCAAMGIEPGPYLDVIAQCGAEGIGDIEPVLIKPTPWETAAIQLGIEPMHLIWRVRWRGSTDLARVEARVAQAVSHALRVEPRLNRTIAHYRSELYQAVSPIVGVRRLWRPDHVMTIYAREPDWRSTDAVEASLARVAAQCRSLPYPEPPVVSPGLAELAPPARAAATVSIVAGANPPGAVGAGPLIPAEGNTWAVFGDSFERRWGRRYLNLSVTCDHRAHGGLEMGRFASLVKEYLESET